ncbi:unnamed protein product [Clonostachys rhizophaga]|uniref:Transcription factor domain-containing protein n=1 Tax=Clonostachys rhizophaga TaxID=160324 RepID=A0A9N9VXU8_9HYPO|nr:unnamed protein product [Clonostachys rhizophaga]
MGSDAANLDSTYAGKIHTTAVLGNHIVFRICPVQQVLKAQPYVYQPESSSTLSSGLSRCIWLPQLDETKVFLENFIRVAHYFPHVTHIPHLPSILERVYANLSLQQEVQPGHFIRVLRIIAAATYSWAQSDGVNGAFSSLSDANEQVSLWITAAEDVVEATSRRRKISIEGVQGMILIGFMAAHIDGLHRYRVLFANTLVLAQDLGLHRIDHPLNSGKANTSQAEIKRRVWWYLCASDWAMAARVGGVGEGVYSCHPRQMITKKPLNINDEEVLDDMSRHERPLSLPTSMSYTLQKIRLAEVSRNIADRSPLMMAYTGGLSHDAVMDIDTELQTLINEVPGFYSMTPPMLMETYGLTQARAEDINADIDNVVQNKLTELLVGVFLACAVLLMDAYISPLSPQQHEQREEIFRSFKIMEIAKKGSETTSKLVDSLMHILRKHQTSASDFVPSERQEPLAYSGGKSERDHQIFPYEETSFDNSIPPGYGIYDNLRFPETTEDPFNVNNSPNPVARSGEHLDFIPEDISSYWTDFTHKFEEGVEIDPKSFDWGSIFMELDSSFI